MLAFRTGTVSHVGDGKPEPLLEMGEFMKAPKKFYSGHLLGIVEGCWAAAFQHPNRVTDILAGTYQLINTTNCPIGGDMYALELAQTHPNNGACALPLYLLPTN